MTASADSASQHDPHSGQERRFAAAGWGLFFVWIGLATLMSVPSWGTLSGIGVITLGVQAARKSVGLRVESFWLVVGLFFLLAGAWDFVGTSIPLLPVLLILVGASVILSVLRGRRD